MIRLFVDYQSSLSVVTASDIEEFIQAAQQLIGHQEDFRFTVEGRDIEDYGSDEFNSLDNQVIQVEAIVLGGKGGFGSLLRIAAAQKKHFNNFDSARDSSGRRLRDIRNELRLMDFVKKKKREQQFVNQELGEIANKPPEPRANTHNQAVAKVAETYGLKTSKWENKLHDSIRTALEKKKNKNSSLLQKVEEATTQNDESELQETKYEEATLGKRSQLPRHVTSKKNKKSNKESIESEETTSAISKSSRKNSEKKVSPTKEITKDSLLPAMVGPIAPKIAALNFPPIDLQKLSDFDDFLKLDPEHVKHELKRLGVKCGGLDKERAKRLFDIKLDPSNLYNPKFLSKSK